MKKLNMINDFNNQLVKADGALMEYFEFGQFWLIVKTENYFTEYWIYEEDDNSGSFYDENETVIFGSFTAVANLSSKNYDDCFHYFSAEEGYIHMCGHMSDYIELLQYIVSDQKAKMVAIDEARKAA